MSGSLCSDHVSGVHAVIISLYSVAVFSKNACYIGMKLLESPSGQHSGSTGENTRPSTKPLVNVLSLRQH